MRSSWLRGAFAISAGPLSSFFDPEIAAQKPSAEAVEGPDRQVLELPFAEQTRKPFLHLPRRLVREGHRQDRARRDAQVADQVRDSVREDARLARPGAGQDEQRPIAVRDGGALLGIQGVE